MYKQFYQLRRNPFEITPDPSFLFPTKRHNEALAALYYGVRRHKGFVVMTGEVGTGKTLLVRCLLELLRRAEVGFAYIFNPRLSPLEFLRYIGRDLGLPVTGKAKDELLLDLGAYLIDRHRKKLTTVLVVDEAHHLSSDVLEEIRLLTNLETSQEKLLQILLVGQPELDEQLDSVELRQLKQRVALRCHLDPLAPQETKDYVRRRLQVAGASEADAEIPRRGSLSGVRWPSRTQGTWSGCRKRWQLHDCRRGGHRRGRAWDTDLGAVFRAERDERQSLLDVEHAARRTRGLRRVHSELHAGTPTDIASSDSRT